MTHQVNATYPRVHPRVAWKECIMQSRDASSSAMAALCAVIFTEPITCAIQDTHEASLHILACAENGMVIVSSLPTRSGWSTGWQAGSWCVGCSLTCVRLSGRNSCNEQNRSGDCCSDLQVHSKLSCPILTQAHWITGSREHSMQQLSARAFTQQKHRIKLWLGSHLHF